MSKRVYTEEARRQALAYLRGDRWGESVDTQRKLITRHADLCGLTIMNWYLDNAEPGYDRLEWDDATDVLRKGPVYRLLYTSLDRLGDRALDLITLAETAESEGWFMEGLDGTSSGPTPHERATFSLYAVQVELAVNLRAEGRHSLRFSDEEMKALCLVLRAARGRADAPTVDAFLGRFDTGHTGVIPGYFDRRKLIPVGEVVERYKAGESVVAITQDLRARGITVSQSLVSTTLKDAGVVMRRGRAAQKGEGS